jgi:hypothetical protein
MSVISGNTTVYIRQGNGVNIQEYSINEKVSWTDITWPCTIINNNVGARVYRKVEFVTDISFSGNDRYFIIGSEYIQIGKLSLNSDNSRTIITISNSSNYPGLFKNYVDANFSYSNVAIMNLEIKNVNTTLLFSYGWFCHNFYATNAKQNYIINCHSYGSIANFGGGIVGAFAGGINGELIIKNCSSSGSITTYAGGIIGPRVGGYSEQGQKSGIIIIDSCRSRGSIGNNAGGIVGQTSGLNIFQFTISNCYSEGNIGTNAGGIVADFCGTEVNNTFEIKNCYSLGTVILGGGGGIVGGQAYKLTVTNCYSVGTMTQPTSGGICGVRTPNQTSITITNCYVGGSNYNGTGYIFGNETIIPSTCFSEAFSTGNFDWNESNARQVLTGIPTVNSNVGEIWCRVNAVSYYTLNKFGFSPYSANNILYLSNEEDKFVLNKNINITLKVGKQTISGIDTSSNTNYNLFTTYNGIFTINNSNGSVTISNDSPGGVYVLTIQSVFNTLYSFSTMTLTVILPTKIRTMESTVYIRQNGLNQEYRIEDENMYTTIIWPCTIQNLDETKVLNVRFETDLLLTDSDQYFIFNKIYGNICIGNRDIYSTSDINMRTVIEIDGVNDYLGFLSNYNVLGSADNITVCNLDIRSKNNSFLQTGSGWVCQQYFGFRSLNNFILNCCSNGDIPENGGGICGSFTCSGISLGKASMSIINCFSLGDIEQDGGGITGSKSGDFGNLTINSCWSKGEISTSGGGIAGSFVALSSSSITNITSCYSNGKIGEFGGGIVGRNPGNVIDGIVNIYNCYSTGEISDYGGGIAGFSQSTESLGNCTIVNCYTLGKVNNFGGGIVGGPVNMSSVKVRNCYTAGIVLSQKGFIYSGSSIVPNTCYSEGKSRHKDWKTKNAIKVLQGIPNIKIGDVWVDCGYNVPFELVNVGFTPYVQEIIDENNSLKTTVKISVLQGKSILSVVKNSYYSLLEINGQGPLNFENKISIMSNGTIITKPDILPGKYTLNILNTGSYNYSTVVLTVEADYSLSIVCFKNDSSCPEQRSNFQVSNFSM